MRGSRLFLSIITAAILLPAAFAAVSFGAVRFDVVGSPTEVINTGRSEVIGSITLVVRGTANMTGTSAGGATQIGLTFADPPLQIDNTTASGIKLISSPGFAAASPAILSVENREINGQCTGLVAINILPGATPTEGDFITIEGIRGRIDASRAITAGTDLFVDLQSINDPAANSFAPDRIRVAKSLQGLNLHIASDGLNFEIQIGEGFARAFVDSDANNDGINSNDRTDTTAAALGAPTNSTQFNVRVEGIPSGITSVIWPATSTVASTGAALRLISSDFSGSTSTAVYSFEAVNQVGSSDLVVESFSLVPEFVFTGGECNTDELTASVTLAPSVTAASGCSANSSTTARPRFLESFELTLTGLTPSSVVAGGKEFTLTVRGTGFVPGSTVLWNGSSLATTYVSSTLLKATVPASNIVKAGSATVAVSNPATLGTPVSRPATFTITPPALTLYYPRLVASDSSPDGGDFTGIAVANPSGRIATLKLTAFDRAGNRISGSGITNPATLTLQAGRQLPLIDSQIFGSGFRAASQVGWVKLEGDVPQVVGFFLAFNGSLSRLDGADVSSKTLTSLVFPQIEREGENQIHVANPNDTPAAVRFDLVSSAGATRASAVRTLDANGAEVEFMSDLFPGVPLQASDYVRAVASEPVVPFEYLLKTARDSEGLNGQDTTGGANILYSPQYVVGGSDWESTLAVVNLSSSAGNVSLKFIADDGTQIGNTQVLPVTANGKILITDQKFFVDAGNTLKQGYVEITGSSGLKLTGSIEFGSPGNHTFRSALPLLSTLQTEMVFGQVASNQTFFTGLSVFNPNDEGANVVIQVFDDTGAALASKMIPVGAKSRKVQLLTQLFPDLAGRNLSAGYVTLSSIKGLAAFALFGSNDLSVLSAVPAQIVP